jgi:phosphatidylserine/phosphatidylglycerophosphate/cardiolipin synthase-like enzyme
LPLTRQGTVDAMLKAGAPHGLFRQHSPMTWSPLAETAVMRRLAWMLQGASNYIELVHHNTDEVEVVLTKPTRPSELERALREAGYEQVGLVATGEMFPAMAAGANEHFTVMTPFLDLAGAEALVQLFERSALNVEPRLIFRSSPMGLPDGYLATADTLLQLGVRVFDYRLERDGGGFETFHAKVVLADRNWAYVGSTNMTQWSLPSRFLQIPAAFRVVQLSRVE